MGCAASADNGKNDHKEKDRTSRRKRRDRHVDDTSEMSQTSPATQADGRQTPASDSKDANPLAVAPGPTSVPAHDDGTDLSDISSTDLGASMVRAQTMTANPIGGKGLDAEREQAEVDLEQEYFTWDDATLNLGDLAKLKKQNILAAAARKRDQAAPPPPRAALPGAKPAPNAGGNSDDFRYGDFALGAEDSATMAALSESGRFHPLRRQQKESEVKSFRKQPTRTGPKRPPGDIKGFAVSTRIGHSSRVKCLAIAPGEREYVSCSNDDSIVTYYDVRSSQELGIYSGHQDTVIHAVFSPCGKYLATTSRDNTLMLWDVVTQKAILTFEHGKVVICCAFSRSSQIIATGCQDKVCRLWQIRKGQELVAFAQHEGIIISLSISPDETNVVSASADKTLRIWTVSKGKLKAVLRGHTHIILACNYSADGTKIISNDERSVRIWAAKGGQPLKTIMVEDLVHHRSLPANKKQSWTLSCVAPKAFPNHFIVAANNRMVFIVNMETGEETLSVDTKAPVYCLAPGHRNLIAYGDSFGNVYFMRLECFDEDEPINDRPGGADWA